MPDGSAAISISFGSNLIYEAAELERLLAETEGPALPSYLDNLDNVDQRLHASGFTRSPSQPMTPSWIR